VRIIGFVEWDCAGKKKPAPLFPLDLTGPEV